MRSSVKSGKLLVLGSLIAAGLPLGSHAAHASKAAGDVHISHDGGHHHSDHAANHTGRSGHHHRFYAESRSHGRHDHYGRHGHQYASTGGISCVPFARQESGIEVAGNAADWWGHAEGVYARGHRPEIGSVLNFRANGHMHLGHVAVVKEVTDNRHLVIDHANWGGPGTRRGGISRHVTVVDVSADNDWTAVRVELGQSGNFGSTYPTYGFIYARNDGGTTVARNTDADHGNLVAATTMSATTMPVMNVASISHHDMRPRLQRAMASRHVNSFDEVAEAPITNKRGLDLSTPLNLDAPFRSFR